MVRLLFIFFLCCTTLNAQKLEHLTYRITSKEQLPDKEIYRILEDEKGFIWLATNSGLYKYNGEDFILYRHAKQRKQSVFGLLFDNKNRLWFNTIDGQYFYVENDKVVLFKDFQKQTKEILSLFTIIHNYLYIHFDKKIAKINIKTKQETSLNYKTIRKAQSPILNYNNKIVTVIGTKLFPIKEITTTKIKKSPFHSLIFKSKVLILNRLRGFKNEFYFVTENTTKAITSFKKVENLAINYLKEINGFLWIFTSRGAYKYEYINNNFVLKDVFLEEKQVTDAILDKQNNLWFTTLNSGAYIAKNQTVFKLKRKYSEDYITSFTAVNDSVISFIEGKKYFTVVNTQNKKVHTQEIKSFNQKLFYDKHTNKINLLVEGTVFIYDIKKATFLNKYRAPSPKAIIRVNDNKLLSSYYSRLIVYDNNYKILLRKKGRCKELAFNTFSNCVYVDFFNGLQVGTSTKNLQPLLYNNKKVHIKSIAVKPNSNEVFVVTNNNTILQVNKDVVVDKIPIKITKINSINVNENYLWIGTENAVFRYNFKQKKVVKLYNLFNFQIKKIELTNNFVWLVTDNTVIRMPKNYTEKLNKIHTPYFLSVKVNNQEVNLKKVINITDKQQNITAKFMINGFKVLNLYNFEYKITNNQWNKTQNNEITISQLPYGNQELSVRAVHKKSGEKTAIAKVNFNVIRPFYKTWWFISIIFIILGTTAFKLTQNWMFIQHQKKEKELQQLQIKQQLTNLQLENLRSQMNPHFIFNALNSIQEYIYANEKKLASSYLVKFSRLIRMYLEHSRTSEITLTKELEALELYLYLENSRFSNTLQIAVNLPQHINTNAIMVPSLFIQPYVENAIKHGLLHKKGKKELIINFSLHQNNLEVSIKDNGVGRKKSENINKKRSYKSFATNANLNRIDLMNLKRNEKISLRTIDLKDQQQQPTGTEVIIQIPLNTL